MKTKIVSATTFQLTPISKKFKCHFEVGDKVKSPLGKAEIVELDEVTGNCKIKIKE